MPEYTPIAIRDGLLFKEKLVTNNGDSSNSLAELTIGIKSKTNFFCEAKGFHISYSLSESNLFDYSNAVRLTWHPIDGNAPGFGDGDDIYAKSGSITGYHLSTKHSGHQVQEGPSIPDYEVRHFDKKSIYTSRYLLEVGLSKKIADS